MSSAAESPNTAAEKVTVVEPTTTVAPVVDADGEVYEPEPLPKTRAEQLAETAADPDEEKNLYRFDDGFVVDYRQPPKTDTITSEPDPDDGFRPITWKELERVFCYEREAKGFKLCGDISQKQREHWERSKQIRVRDKDGGEAAIFFYDDQDPMPYFRWEDVEVGNTIEIKNPRLHKFMDGQDGMRVEHHKQILKVVKKKFTDEMRLEYGQLNKTNGNTQFALACKAKEKEDEDERVAKEKGIPYKKVSQHMPNSAAKLFDNAVSFYDMAIIHLDRTLFLDDPADPSSFVKTAEEKKDREEKRQIAREALAACYLNIAASQILLKAWGNVEGPCEKALRVNASKALNAKAYFRWGHALLEQGHLRMAEDKLKRADQLNPNDAKILELLHRIAVLKYEEQKNEKEMFQLRQRRKQEAEDAAAAARNGATLVTASPTGDGTIVGSPSSATAAAVTTETTVVTKMNPNFGTRPSLFGPPQAILSGVPNFRDLGGLPCNDSKTVTKKFMLYRSSNLFDLTTGAEGEVSNDLRVLTEDLGIKTVIDLRNQREIEMFCDEAKKLRAEGGLATFLWRRKRQQKRLENSSKKGNNKNKVDGDDDELSTEEDEKENEADDDDGENVEDSDDGSTSGSEGDDDEIRHNKHLVRQQIRKEKREKKIAEKAARKKQKEAEREERRNRRKKPAAITGAFVDYRDFFANIKAICASPSAKNKKKTADDANGNAINTDDDTMESFSSPTLASPPSDAFPTAAAKDEGGAAAASSQQQQKKGFIHAAKKIFMFLSSGGTKPSLTDSRDKSLTEASALAAVVSPAVASSSLRQPVWFRMISSQKKVACPKREPAVGVVAPITATNNNGNSTATTSAEKDEIAFALASRRTILHIDIVTRAFVTAASFWVLLGVAFYFCCFQMKKASQLIAKKVVEKGPSYMYELMIDNQGPEIAEIFALAADERNYPILVTCALGKDRTGVVIALLMAACDVKFEAISKDYADKTNESLCPKNSAHAAVTSTSSSSSLTTKADIAAYLVDLQRSLGVVGKEWDLADAKDIKHVFVYLKNRYGGLHQYLNKIGVSGEQIQSIRRILTKPQ